MTSELINQFVTPLIFAVFALGFGTIWYHYRRFSSAGLFALSYFCGSVAFISEAVFEEHHGHVILPFLTDILYIVITVLFNVALYVRYGLRPPFVVLSAIMIAVVAGLTWYRFEDYQVETRIHIISYGSAAIMLLPLRSIWAKAQHRIDRLLVCLMAFFALQFIVTTTLILRNDGEVLTVSNFSNSVFLAATNFMVSALSLSIAITLFVKYGMDAIRVLRQQTTTDELTRLHNRRGFKKRAEALIWEAFESRAGLSMVVLDLDHFKRINDRFGHTVGDRALKAFAEFISGEVRQSDLFGRIGGEEFCLLLSGAGASIATKVTEGLRKKLAEQDFSGEGVEGRLTVSCGIAELRPGDDYESLFKRADAALYSAKRNGRNRVEVVV